LYVKASGYLNIYSEAATPIPRVCLLRLLRFLAVWNAKTCCHLACVKYVGIFFLICHSLAKERQRHLCFEGADGVSNSSNPEFAKPFQKQGAVKIIQVENIYK